MPDPTIPELVARLRELHEKATPGPWSTNHRGGDISARIRGHEVQVALACGQGAMWDERDDAAAIMRANAELIAELRSSLPAILDALDHIGDANKMVDRLPAAGFEVEECGWRRPSQTAQEFHDVDAEKTMPADRRCAMGSKRYTDSDGNECDLPTMCRREPGWAANRIAALLTERQRHAEEVARLRDVHRGELVSDPWVPIEERGELEEGAEYLVRMKRGVLEPLITIARWSGAEWQVRIVDAERYYFRADHITHVHRMGPIRGPEEERGER